VVEGLSRVIIVARKEGKLIGIRVSGLEYITHLLFVNDVLLFGHGFVREAQSYKEILDLFCKEMGMEVNLIKSSFSLNKLQDEITYRINHLLHFRLV